MMSFQTGNAKVGHGLWLTRAGAVLMAALGAILLLAADRPEIHFRVDDFGHLEFCRHVVAEADRADDGGWPGFVLSAVATAANPDGHFPHVHAGRPVTNVFRVLLYITFGEDPQAFQTVLLLLLVLLTAQLAELAAFITDRPWGGMLGALLFISCPPVSGLLCWTSHLNLVLCLTLAAGGLRLVSGAARAGKWTGLLLGFPMLLGAMLSRETELIVIPLVLAAAAVGMKDLPRWRQFGPALLALALALMLWSFPGMRARSGGGQLLADLPMTLHLAWVTFLAQAGTVLKSVGWFLVLPLALVSGRPGKWILGCAALVLLVCPGGALHALLLCGLLALTLPRLDRARRVGLVWCAAAGLPILLYGAFAGRYAVEPLFGLCLALSPLLGESLEGLRRRRAAHILLMALLGLQLVFNVFPDTVHTLSVKPGLLRRTTHWGEGLVAATESRAKAFATFAGRVPGGWPDPDRRYYRLGPPYAPVEQEEALLVVDRETDRTWEWNSWFWRFNGYKVPTKSRHDDKKSGIGRAAGSEDGFGARAGLPIGRLWEGEEWEIQPLLGGMPEMTDVLLVLDIFSHYRGVATGLGADEEQALVLFETARLFIHDDGRIDAWEAHLLDRIALSW
jgi:hypothetical protein